MCTFYSFSSPVSQYDLLKKVASIVSMPPGANAPMHSTKSIDYAVVLEGELELELDSGDRTVLKTG